MKNAGVQILFAVLLAFTVSSFVYFGFVNSYSSTIFNPAEFNTQFSSGVYQYRKLSGYFLLWIYDFLGKFNIDYSIFKLKFLNPKSDARFYLSLYVLNTFFLILTAAAAVILSHSKKIIATNAERLFIVVTIVLVAAITQFVILPYDISSYFFLLIFLFVLFKFLEEPKTLALLTLVFILGMSTLNRESSALSISVAATLLVERYGFTKKFIIPTGILGATFLLNYLALRFSGNHFTTNDGNLFLQNFTSPKNLLGILFWLVFFSFTLLISTDKAAQKRILIFYLFAVPYIFMCFYTGILYEARLYVPLFFTSLILSRLSVAKELPEIS